MRVNIYWVGERENYQLGIMARPRGGDWLEDEIACLFDTGVNAVVSLLTEEEISELNISEEEYYCRKNGIEYISFPIIDRNIPAADVDTLGFIKRLITLLREGKSVVIHCRQGIGRSSLIAAAVLSMMGESVEDAFDKIRLSRGCQVPDTPEQRKWVIDFINKLDPRKRNA